MRYTKFVQSGNHEQSNDNGMSNLVYSIGASNGRTGNFTVLIDGGLSGPDWSIPEEYATTFSLELILEKKYNPVTDWDIPF